MTVIERDPAYDIARNCESMGIVWFTDGLIQAASAFRPEDDDPDMWVNNIEQHYARLDKPILPPFHFYVAQSGEIFEGLGWGARSRWHEMGKNQDVPHDGGNSTAVLFLGASEEFTTEAQRACRWLVDEHQRQFTYPIRNLRYSQVNDNSKSGGAPGSPFHDWTVAGCPSAPPAEDEEPEVELPTEEWTNARIREWLQDNAKVVLPSIINKTTLLNAVEEFLDSEEGGSVDPTEGSPD